MNFSIGEVSLLVMKDVSRELSGTILKIAAHNKVTLKEFVDFFHQFR